MREEKRSGAALLRELHTGFPGSPLTCVLLVHLLSNVMSVPCPELAIFAHSCSQRVKADSKEEKVLECWRKCKLVAEITCGDRGGGQLPMQHPRERIHLGILLFCTSSLLHSEDHLSPARNHEWGDGRNGGGLEVQKAHLL